MLRREGSDPVTVLKATFIFACRDSVQKIDEESCVVIEEEEEDYRVLVHDNEILMFITASSNTTMLPRKRW